MPLHDENPLKLVLYLRKGMLNIVYCVYLTLKLIRIISKDYMHLCKFILFLLVAFVFGYVQRICSDMKFSKKKRRGKSSVYMSAPTCTHIYAHIQRKTQTLFTSFNAVRMPTKLVSCKVFCRKSM